MTLAAFNKSDLKHRYIPKPIGVYEDKAKKRAEIDAQVAEFLARGGQVEKLSIREYEKDKAAEYSVLINGIEYQAISGSGITKTFGIARSKIAQYVASGDGPVFQKQVGGKKENLYPIEKFTKWARERGLM